MLITSWTIQIMTIWIDTQETPDTRTLMATVLMKADGGERVQFLVPASTGNAVAQRMRVALSRSRTRNRLRGKKIKQFTLHHSVYPWTDAGGKRFDCVVMWIEKTIHHRKNELLEDLLERD